MALKKNPLLQALGAIIRRERERRFWDYSLLEEKSSISSNYLRSIEQGAFSIHISKAYSLFEAFKAGNESVDTFKSFSLEGLIQYISICSILETRAADRIRQIEKKTLMNDEQKATEYTKGLVTAAVDLHSTNNKFKKLFDSFFQGGIFSLTTSEEAIDFMERYGILSEVEDFLINYQWYALEVRDRQKDYLDNFFDKIPGMYFEFVEEVTTRVSEFPNEIGMRDLRRWQLKNSRKFEELHIFADDYCEKFNKIDSHNYSFLWESQFKKLVFYDALSFSSLKKPIEKLQNDLRLDYPTKYAHVSREKLNRGIEKVHIKKLRTYEESIKNLIQNVNLNPKAFGLMIFKFTYMKYVVFAIALDRFSSSVICLTVEEIRKNINIINELVDDSNTP